MNKYEGLSKLELMDALDDLLLEKENLQREIEWDSELDKEWKEVTQEIDTVEKLLADTPDI